MAYRSDDIPSIRPAVVLLLALAIVFAGAVTAHAQNAPAVYAKTIFHNGTVVTVDPQQSQAEALAVAPDGTILAVGTESEVMKTKGPSTEIVELQGHTLMPGFVEPHTHVMVVAFETHMKALTGKKTDLVIDLSSFKEKWPTIRDLKTVLRGALSDVPKGGWLLGFGVDPSRTTPFMATLDVHELDDVSEDVPIFILNQSAHYAYVNTAALVAADILDPLTKAIKEDPGNGGRYLRNDQGGLTGVVAEAASYQAFQKAWADTPTGKAMDEDARLAALRTTYKCFAADGITTATEFSLGTALPGATKEFAMLKKLAQEEATQLRIRAYAAIVVTEPKEVGDLMKQQNEEPGFPLEMLKLLGIKFVEDGSTQGLSAALTEPYMYPDFTENKGNPNYKEDKLFEKAKSYLDVNRDWQLAIHSNGDQSTRTSLAVFEKLFKEEPFSKLKTREERATKRWRIDHYTVVNKDQIEDQIEKVWELGLTPGMTIGHVGYWGYSFNEKQILGSERAKQIDPAKWLLDKADEKKTPIPFAFNSDAPVSPAKPLRYISTAVTRRYQHGGDKPLGEEQKIPIDAAIRAVTIDAAYQLFLEDKIGSLEKGKWADLVILEKNPLEVAKDHPEDIGSIKVLSTWLKGVKKYPAKGDDKVDIDCTPRMERK